ncbi:MAG TPA: sulfite exporter TauE/SafE family protein, partial [Actinomycetota bacterium]|nr:sulfite exporter TauE/SafE family protein [Actinomycetota bacterium]
AAWTIRFIPARGLGVAVGGLLLLTNVRELANYLDVRAMRWAAYGLVVAASSYAAARPGLQQRRARRAWVPTEPAPEIRS